MVNYSANMSKEVVDSYPVFCNGVDNSLDEPVEVSLAVFYDGSRQVGCVNLGLFGECQAKRLPQQSKDIFENTVNQSCFHLNPVDSTVSND